MRLPKNKYERWEASINSTIDDIYYSHGRVILSGVLSNGDRIYLGDIDEGLFYQKDVDLEYLVNYVRFGGN